jgi:hypothetical protein
MQTKVKLGVDWDKKALRPDLAISNIRRFFIRSNLAILPCGALFLSKEKEIDDECPASIFRINLSIEANNVFFTKFDSLVSLNDNGFFTACRSYSTGGAEVIISGVNGDYRMFINRCGCLCIEKA